MTFLYFRYGTGFSHVYLDQHEQPHFTLASNESIWAVPGTLNND